MKYKQFGKLSCPACGRRNSAKMAACPHCGLLLVNYCSRQGCEQLLDGNARFCVKCGDISVYYREGFLDDWEEELQELESQKLESYVFRDEDLEAFED